MSLKFPITLLPLGLLLGASVLITPSFATPADDAQPFKVTAEIISQRYCPTNDKTYTVIFKLHTRYVNQTNHKLIVEKGIGSFIPHLNIASDAKNLSEGKYEYDMNEDWIFEQIPPGTPEQLKTPGPGFAILPPGESLQNDGEYWATSVGPLPGLPTSRGAIQPGNHVLAFLIWPWTFHADGQDVHKKWESFGDLVYKTIKVGPLPFTLPPDPKIEKCN